VQRRIDSAIFLFAILLLLFALGAWFGLTFLWPVRAGTLPGIGQLGAVTAARESQNAAIQTRIDILRAGLKGDICKVDRSLIPGADGLTPQTPIAPSAVPPPQAGQLPFKGNLADLLDQATVLIIAGDSANKNMEQGSGFFISPSLIVTNNHVIANADPDQILVFNAKIGKPLQAKLVASTGTDAIGGPDFAVLQVEPQTAVQPLALTSSVAQLQSVTAAGFPAFEGATDRQYAALMNGDLSLGVPSVDLTTGEISAIQTSNAGLKILPHTAMISPGNSGGPLADQCGRVVGIDTFENVDTSDAVHLNYALEANALAGFLGANQMPVTIQTDGCTGPATPQASPPQEAPQTSTAQPPAEQSSP
jgi:S1-C subfamily serine protease